MIGFKLTAWFARIPASCSLLRPLDRTFAMAAHGLCDPIWSNPSKTNPLKCWLSTNEAPFAPSPAGSVDNRGYLTTRIPRRIQGLSSYAWPVGRYKHQISPMSSGKCRKMVCRRWSKTFKKQGSSFCEKVDTKGSCERRRTPCRDVKGDVHSEASAILTWCGTITPNCKACKTKVLRCSESPLTQCLMMTHDALLAWQQLEKYWRVWVTASRSSIFLDLPVLHLKEHDATVK